MKRRKLYFLSVHYTVSILQRRKSNVKKNKDCAIKYFHFDKSEFAGKSKTPKLSKYAFEQPEDFLTRFIADTVTCEDYYFPNILPRPLSLPPMLSRLILALMPSTMPCT